MIQTDSNWLTKLGVTTSTQNEMDELVTKATDELEMRVGSQIAEILSSEQIKEFEGIQDEDKMLEWMEAAVPGYKKIAETEYEKMGNEIKEADDKAELIKSWINP